MDVFHDNEELIINFNSLLFEYGYNPLHLENYIKFEFIESKVYTVDEKFPRLVKSMLKETLSERVSKIRYRIQLDGLDSKTYNNINLGDYCY